MASQDDDPIEHLPNLGPKSALWLRDVGIRTLAELRRRGPVVAFRLVKQNQPKASLNLLWALAAGLQGKDWRNLSDKDKADLKREANSE